MRFFCFFWGLLLLGMCALNFMITDATVFNYVVGSMAGIGGLVLIPFALFAQD